MTQRPDLRLTRQGGHATPEAQDEVLDWKDATRNLNNLSSRISKVFVYFPLLPSARTDHYIYHLYIYISPPPLPFYSYWQTPFSSSPENGVLGGMGMGIGMGWGWDRAGAGDGHQGALIRY